MGSIFGLVSRQKAAPGWWNCNPAAAGPFLLFMLPTVEVVCAAYWGPQVSAGQLMCDDQTLTAITDRTANMLASCWCSERTDEGNAQGTGNTFLSQLHQQCIKIIQSCAGTQHCHHPHVCHRPQTSAPTCQPRLLHWEAARSAAASSGKATAAASGAMFPLHTEQTAISCLASTCARIPQLIALPLAYEVL